MSNTTRPAILNETGERSWYDEYQDSGVEWLGEIPSHWNSVRLRFLLEVSPSKTEVRSLPEDTEVSFVPMDSIREDGGLDLDKTKELREVLDGYTYFRKGDVLVAKITPCFENRKGALASDLTNGVGFGTTEVHVLRPGSKLDKGFLFYSTMSHPFRKIGESTMYGAGGQKRVSDDFIENLRWPVPSLSEQRTIAEYLDRETERIDALIGKKEQLIDLLEEKRTALISRVVTQGLDRDVEMQDSGVEWLGEIPAHWDTVKLKWNTDKIGSGVTPDGGSEAYVDEGITFLRSQNVHFDGLRLDDVAYIDEETDREMESTRVHPGDVLLNITGASIGRCTRVPEDFPRANVNQHVCIIRAQQDELHPSFLNHVMASSVGQEQIFAEIDGASRDAVTFAEIGNFIVPKPPKEEQDRIAEHIEQRTSQLYSLIDQIKEGIELLEEYRTALISAAVTGEIDVREDARKPERKEADTWDRMVLTMELIRRMHTAQHESLGRTLLVKMLYLIQHHVRVAGMSFNYKRKNYGPYAPELRYEVENALQSQGWIQVSEGNEQVRYELLGKADDETVQSYFEGSWGDVEEQIDEIVSYFHHFDAERAEIVATLYAAWNDLKILNRPHDDDAIIREVRENWHPRKREIEESRWRKALNWMKDEGLVPTGFGEPTIDEHELD